VTFNYDQSSFSYFANLSLKVLIIAFLSLMIYFMLATAWLWFSFLSISSAISENFCSSSYCLFFSKLLDSSFCFSSL